MVSYLSDLLKWRVTCVIDVFRSAVIVIVDIIDCGNASKLVKHYLSNLLPKISTQFSKHFAIFFDNFQAISTDTISYQNPNFQHKGFSSEVVSP